MLYQLGVKRPEILGGKYFIAGSADLIGEVFIHDQVSIWFGAVLRADNEKIVVNKGTNIQDGAVLHTDPGYPLVLGCDVTVGHKAMLHGCTIGDGSLIGISATILNGAEIGRNCVIGANALVTQGAVIPDNSVVMGMPGKVVKLIDGDALNDLKEAAQTYKDKLEHYCQSLKVCEF